MSESISDAEIEDCDTDVIDSSNKRPRDYSCTIVNELPTMTTNNSTTRSGLSLKVDPKTKRARLATIVID